MHMSSWNKKRKKSDPSPFEQIVVLFNMKKRTLKLALVLALLVKIMSA